jgi:hypothetical protein
MDWNARILAALAECSPAPSVWDEDCYESEACRHRVYAPGRRGVVTMAVTF